jgi:hypothetical protein
VGFFHPRPLKYTSVSAHGRTAPEAKKEEKIPPACAENHPELLKKTYIVTPAQAGSRDSKTLWIPAFAGMTPRGLFTISCIFVDRRSFVKQF